jgi:hypothetical protein
MDRLHSVGAKSCEGREYFGFHVFDVGVYHPFAGIFILP